MKVDKVADMKADLIVDLVLGKVANMKVDKVLDFSMTFFCIFR